jgi:DNA-binding response OmpR family regulator
VQREEVLGCGGRRIRWLDFFSVASDCSTKRQRIRARDQCFLNRYGKPLHGRATGAISACSAPAGWNPSGRGQAGTGQQRRKCMREWPGSGASAEIITSVADILVVEDEDSLLQTLRYNLARAGHEVRLCSDGAQALEVVLDKPPDLLVLDLMLPRLGGLEVCRAIRAEASRPAVSQVPILILTARDEEIDKVVGLEMGADDYLTKPFSMHELLARVKALLRRAEMRATAGDLPVRLEAGDLVVDIAARRATRAGQPLQLKRREFDLLAYFLQHAGQVLSRDRLLRHVWGYGDSGDTRTVDVHVRWLRSKIERDPSAPERLQSVRGVGYVFAG